MCLRIRHCLTWVHEHEYRENHYSTMSDKLQRTIARFQERIDNKDYYEAHQTLRTITNRYVRAKQYDLAIGILQQGAQTLAASGQAASASDLIGYLIQVYKEAGIRCGSGPEKEYKSKLIELVSQLPYTDSSLGDLAKAALLWLQESTSKFGDANLHHVFGTKFLAAVDTQQSPEDKQKMFAVAEMHLVLGTFESLPVYVDYLSRWYELSGASDGGVFLARAVINYAYLKNLKFAQTASERFLAKLAQKTPHQQVEGLRQFEGQPIADFLQLLVVTLEKKDAGDKFMKLYTHYKSTLAAAELVAPVEYLGRFYFGLNLGSAQGGGNMLANLMSGLFG